MALVDDQGDVVNTYDYDVFGALRASSGSQANDFTFAGEDLVRGLLREPVDECKAISPRASTCNNCRAAAYAQRVLLLYRRRCRGSAPSLR